MIRSPASPGKLVPFELARARIIAAFPRPDRYIELPVEEAIGRVLAAPVKAGFSIPGTDVAEVDGFAVRSRETEGAVPGESALIETGGRVDTGRPLPPGTDAVVPIEDCCEQGTGIIVEMAVRAGEGVRSAGSELARGTTLLEVGHRVRPSDIGPLVAAGVTGVLARSARVGVVPTGDELVVPGTRPGPGESIASNPVAIRALLAPQGAVTVVAPVTRDDPTLIRNAIDNLLDNGCDLVVVCGGSGRGTRDVAFGVVRSIGQVVVDGVAARPGRSFLVVRAGDIPVVSLPGRAQPVTLLTEYFLVPLLAAWGLPAPGVPSIPVRLGLSIVSHPGFTETVPLSVASVNGVVVGVRQPRGRQGALSQLRANARLLIPDGIETCEAGTVADAELLGDPDSVDRTVLVVGAIDQIEVPGERYRAALVPCAPHEAHALLKASACHVAVFTDGQSFDGPFLNYRGPGGSVRQLAVPPGLTDDPKVSWVLAALGLTR